MTRGTLDRPFVVQSPAVIDGQAAREPCLRCGGEGRVHEHTRPRAGIRRVDVACRQCSAPRTLWFRLVLDEPN